MSNGCGAILAALTVIERPVVVFGMDDLKNGKNDRANYIGSWFWEGRNRERILRKGHDYAVERRLVDKMQSEYGLSVEFV